MELEVGVIGRVEWFGGDWVGSGCPFVGCGFD